MQRVLSFLGWFLLSCLAVVHGQSGVYIIGAPISLTYNKFVNVSQVNLTLWYLDGTTNNTWELGTFNNSGTINTVPDVKHTTVQFQIPDGTTGHFAVVGGVGVDKIYTSPELTLFQPLKFDNSTPYAAASGKSYTATVQIQQELMPQISELTWMAELVEVKGQNWTQKANTSATGRQVTRSPTRQPTMPTTHRPTRKPTGAPTQSPVPTTAQPTVPSVPSPNPTRAPTMKPTPHPTRSPTAKPSPNPTRAPTMKPSKHPTMAPTKKPSPNPTRAPTMKPTKQPTAAPTKPTPFPTLSPTKKPSKHPTMAPTKRPSKHPTMSPTKKPTPSPVPTKFPTMAPTKKPSKHPTMAPTKRPSKHPTLSPTKKPTLKPTPSPTQPTSAPTKKSTIELDLTARSIQSRPNRIQLTPKQQVSVAGSNLYEVEMEIPSLLGMYDLNVGFSAVFKENGTGAPQNLTFYTILGAPNFATPLFLYNGTNLSITFEKEMITAYEPVRMTVSDGGQSIPLAVGLTLVDDSMVSVVGCYPPYKALDYTTFGWITNQGSGLFGEGNYMTSLYWYPENVDANNLGLYALTGDKPFPLIQIVTTSDSMNNSFIVHDASKVILTKDEDVSLNITTAFDKNTTLLYNFIQKQEGNVTYNSSNTTFHYNSSRSSNSLIVSVPDDDELSTSLDMKTYIQFMAKDCSGKVVITNLVPFNVAEGEEDDSDSNKLNVGEIVGIAIGGALLLLIIAYITWRYVKHRRSRDTEPAGYNEIAETE